ncbi:MAG: S8 family serine peptidase, partial [Ilumatobacteraceae bacterium]
MSVPSDSEWSGSQWNLWGEFGVGVADGAESMTDAWASGAGEGVTVAVIDTGVTSHPDLDSQLVGGFDFVSNPEQLAAVREENGTSVPFDGDYVNTTQFGALGRDADPSDPGDWRGVVPVRGSSWHGTQIAGVIAAQANNQQGIAGVAPGATIQPIRALSWRGGLLSDIAAAITWASGGRVEGVPANATPSQVINLSFAVETQCPTALQAAIDTALANGSIVVAAAGNANANVAGFAPANCDGVIAVGATTREGVRASYSNWGAGIDISAPGGSSQGGVLTTSNTGATSPAAASYGNDEGTSVAAAHVAGAAAVVWSQDRTQTAASVVERLTGREYATQFANGSCDADAGKTCGVGILSLAQIAMVRQDAIDYALKLNGTSQYAFAQGATFPITGDITLQAWVRPTSANCSGDRVVIRKYFDFGIWCGGSTGQWWYTIGAANQTPLAQNTEFPVFANEWQHLALTRAAGQDVVDFYVNGQLVHTGVTGGAGTGPIRTSSDDLEIGSYVKQFALFPGSIDEVRIWNTVRTGPQIAADMHTYGPILTNGIATPSLLAYYDFNEGPAGATGTGTVYNRVSGASSSTNLRTVGEPTYTDVKQVTSNGNNTVITFPRSYLTAAGGWRVPQGVTSADALVVGGGGGGGWTLGGGGGGGGVKTYSGTAPVSGGIVAEVVVGQGGSPGIVNSNWSQTAGQPSSLGSDTIGGGGYGGMYGNAGGDAPDNSYVVRGSGGGRSYPGNGSVASGTTNGGKGADFSGGGGGGAGANGGDGPAQYYGGNGGVGSASSITGSSVVYGSGGGGGGRHLRAHWRHGGGSGGSGAGNGGSGTAVGGSADANRGGGGGGGGNVALGGWGGSGVVIVSYSTAASGTCSPEESQYIDAAGDAFRVVSFTDTGTCSWTVPDGVSSVDALVVGGGGGGGGGGYYNLGNGGGGGGG